MNILHCSVSLLLLLCLAGSGVAAGDAAADAAAQVAVTNITLDPEVFMPGDTGTVTIEVTNNGPQGVAIRRATLYDNNIILLSGSYDTTTAIGAGNKMRFSFTVKADVPEGIYYPVFSLDFRDAGYLRYPIKLQVQNDPLWLSILDKPDTFMKDKKDTIGIMVGNPRDNRVSSLIVYPKGEGIQATPNSIFIGNLDPDASKSVEFSIIPSQSTDLVIWAEYKNGINTHNTSGVIPLSLGESKKQADPILSNIQVKYENAVYSVSGDVTNAGLEVANSVVVSTGGDVTPTDPYRSYVVGALQPDDFSSFEVTFKAQNISSVPVVVSYKDADGNLFSRSSAVEIPATTTGSSKEPGIPLPIIALLIAAAVGVGCVVWYSWRRR